MAPATQTGAPSGHDPTRSSANQPATPHPAALVRPAAPDAASSRPGEAHGRPSVALLAVAGTELLLISELVDRLERLEGDLGIGWLNVTIAAVIATGIVGLLALIGDSALNAAARRIGHRPGERLLIPVLATAGGGALCGILAAHLGHPLALDSWIGLSGALLLLLGAAHRHAATRAPEHRPGPSGSA